MLANPFSGRTACIPTSFNFPSQKCFARAQGTFYTGNLGFGFVAVNPWAGMWTGGTASPFATSSDSNNTATTIAVSGDNIRPNNSNSPFPVASNQSGVECRLVACGLRVRNVTPLMYRGGTLVGAEMLNHTTSVGNDMSTLLLQTTAERCSSTSNKWSYVTYHPEDEDEFDFIGGASSNVAPGTMYSNQVLVFVANAAASVEDLGAQLYEWEACVVFEAKGTQASSLTPSMSDPTGLAAIQNVTSSPDSRKPKQEVTSESYASWLWDRAQHYAKPAGQLAIAGAATYYGAPLLGAAALPMLTSGSDINLVD